MAAMSLEEQVKDRKALLDRLNKGIGEASRRTAANADQETADETGAEKPNTDKTVEGYKMEEIDTRDETTDLSSSGIQWAASLFVLLLMAVFFWGTRHRR